MNNIGNHISEFFKPFDGTPLTPIGRKTFFLGFILIVIFERIFFYITDFNLIQAVLMIWIYSIWFTRRYIDISPTSKVRSVIRNFLIYFAIYFSISILQLMYIDNNTTFVDLLDALFLPLVSFILIFGYNIFKKGLEHKKRDLHALLTETKQ
jgi:L-asparagine transporter-like permease